MFLAFSGSLIRAIALLMFGPSSPNPISMARWIEAAAHQIGILLLLGYILRRSGRTFGDIGFRWSFKEVAYGFFLCVAAYLFYVAGALSSIWATFLADPIRIMLTLAKYLATRLF